MRAMLARRLLRDWRSGCGAVRGGLIWQRERAELAGGLLFVSARTSLPDGLNGAVAVRRWRLHERERGGGACVSSGPTR